MRRFFRTPALAFGLALVVAGTASAFVTISSTTTATLYTSVGETFEVDIFLSWDGAGSLTGVFASHGWDSNQAELDLCRVSVATVLRDSTDRLEGRFVRSKLDTNRNARLRRCRG